nr:UDP-N-acetylmuramate--L-alanine ligase [Candidatus Omnitrophota bacterium]
VFIGHNRKNLPLDTDLVGYSSAIKEDNPEIIEAKKRGLAILNKGKLLAKLCEDNKMIAVSGSHGKTTTTSLIGYVLTSLGYKPTVFLGGISLNYLQGAWWGKDYFVIETDESDGSFLDYKPYFSLITNIDREHLDNYRTMKSLEGSFLKFARQTKEKVFGWGDQDRVRKIISQVKGLSFGMGKHNSFRALNFRYDKNHSIFDLYIKDKFVMTVTIPLLGQHNCLNTLGALAFFDYIGEDLQKINKILINFKGTKRRFQIKAEIDGVTFVDDYAHHPTEIKSVLNAARLKEAKRIIVIFQPHRFSRVKILAKEFSKCFQEADFLIVTDIYSAHEKEIRGINTKELVKQIGNNFSGQLHYIEANRLSKEVPSYCQPGDLVLALGAGNINILMEEVVNEFKKNRCQV